MSEIHPKLQAYIATRDRRIAKDRPWDRAILSNHMAELLRNGVVKVGGRASCGGKVDPTWIEFGLWNEIVRKARTLGMEIEESDMRHGNGWATKNGGFWDEREYRLVRA